MSFNASPCACLFMLAPLDAPFAFYFFVRTPRSEKRKRLCADGKCKQRLCLWHGRNCATSNPKASWFVAWCANFGPLPRRCDAPLNDTRLALRLAQLFACLHVKEKYDKRPQISQLRELIRSNLNVQEREREETRTRCPQCTIVHSVYACHNSSPIDLAVKCNVCALDRYAIK